MQKLKTRTMPLFYQLMKILQFFFGGIKREKLGNQPDARPLYIQCKMMKRL